MKKFFWVLILGFFSTICFSQQQQVYVHFIPKVNGVTLTGNTVVEDGTGVKMSIDYFNYYLSNLHLICDGGLDLDFSDSVFLVKMTDYTLDLGLQNITAISSVNFGIGVPSNLNHLDISMYAENHPLYYQNPSMQWGWSAGYAFMIVDGYGDSNNDNVPNVMFQLHNLGDMNYKNVSLSTVASQTNVGQLDVYIQCNLDEWIYGHHPGTVGIVHGSNGVNTAVMNNVNARNVFQFNSSAAIEKAEDFQGLLVSQNQAEGIQVNWKEMKGGKTYSLVDVDGKLVTKGSIDQPQGNLFLSDLASGMYIFTVYSHTADPLHQIRIVR